MASRTRSSLDGIRWVYVRSVKPGVLVAEVLGQSPDAGASLELDTGVEVPEGVHSVLMGRRDAGRFKCWLPDVAVVMGAADEVPLSAGERRPLDRLKAA